MLPPNRWTRSPTSPTATRSAKSASVTNRTWFCRMWLSAIFRSCGARSTGSVSPRRISGLSPTSFPVPVSTIVVSPTRARFRSRRRSRGASAIAISRVTSAGCISTFPAASMPAAGHHHVGHIGILGVEKNGEEFYQITLGGKADEGAKLGALIGPAVPYAQVADVVEDIAAAYVELRARPDELFIDTVKRTGIEPFRERVYATR